MEKRRWSILNTKPLRLHVVEAIGRPAVPTKILYKIKPEPAINGKIRLHFPSLNAIGSFKTLIFTFVFCICDCPE
mgnify:CR=1 FL=1